MRNLAAPGFRLIGPQGEQTPALAPGNGPHIVDIARDGAVGLIGALLGDGDVYVLRDASAPPVIEPGEGRIHLQTSGTTGAPKWRAHEIARLT